MKRRCDEAHQSALATSTLTAVKRYGLFEVWDDNVNQQYTEHTCRFRKNLLAAAVGYRWEKLDHFKMSSSCLECQILACYVALYNGPLVEDFLGPYKQHNKDRKKQRTPFI
eukprot:gene3281-3558_t